MIVAYTAKYFRKSNCSLWPGASTMLLTTSAFASLDGILGRLKGTVPCVTVVNASTRLDAVAAPAPPNPPSPGVDGGRAEWLTDMPMPAYALQTAGRTGPKLVVFEISFP